MTRRLGVPVGDRPQQRRLQQPATRRRATPAHAVPLEGARTRTRSTAPTAASTSTATGSRLRGVPAWARTRARPQHRRHVVHRRPARPARTPIRRQLPRHRRVRPDDAVDLGFTLPSASPGPCRTRTSARLDLNDNGCLTDKERDEDGDMLSNDDELSGRMVPGWWTGEVRRGGSVHGTTYARHELARRGHRRRRHYDGMDDQDFDDYLNTEEIERGIRAPRRRRRPAAEPGRHAGPQRQQRRDRRQGPEVPGGHHGPVGQPVQPLLPGHGLAELRPGASARPEPGPIEDPEAETWPELSGPQPPSHLIAHPALT